MNIRALMRRYPYVAVLLLSTIFVLVMVGAFLAFNSNFWIIKLLAPYALATLYALQGVLQIIVGRKKLQQARSNHEQIIWYKQSSIILGFFIIITTLWYTITLIAIRILPHSLEIPIFCIISVLFGIPILILLILLVRYRQKASSKV